MPSASDLIPVERLTQGRKAQRKPRSSPRKRGAPRKMTTAVKRLTREAMEAGWEDSGGRPDSDEFSRPRTRGECSHARPCLYVSCRHNLYLDVSEKTGAITINHPHLEPHEMAHSCALDIAAIGGLTLEVIGDMMNVVRERIRQIERRALIKLRRLNAGV